MLSTLSKINIMAMKYHRNIELIICLKMAVYSVMQEQCEKGCDFFHYFFRISCMLISLKRFV